MCFIMFYIYIYIFFFWGGVFIIYFGGGFLSKLKSFGEDLSFCPSFFAGQLSVWPRWVKGDFCWCLGVFSDTVGVKNHGHSA